MQLQGWVLGSNRDSLWITKGHQTIQFDIKIETPEGCVFAMYVTRGRESDLGNVAAEDNNNKTAVTFQQVHDRLSHSSNTRHGETTRCTHQERTHTSMCCLRCRQGQAKEHQMSGNNETKAQTMTHLP